MKFGETLYQRSVPKWASYNVNYNELKHLIKTRTSSGTSAPVSIPTPGVSRWQQLEDDLYRVIKGQYDNIALFLRSKQGEIERRLIHLEKQVRIAQRAVAEGALDRPILQARKYQRLVKDAESIGDEIESLSRFAGVQKTAFRKILKKYRKWTGSATLQTRLDVEVFSSGALQVDYADFLQRLSSQSRIISEELASPMLTGQTSNKSNIPAASQAPNRSNAQTINEAADLGLLQLDAALASVPYGEVAGSAFYWIHPDNQEEAEALLLRHMRILGPKSSLAAGDSTTSFPRQNGSSMAGGASLNTVYTVLYDNVQRFTQDVQLTRPSKIALDARWNSGPDAIFTLSSLTPRTAEIDTLKIRRKDVANALLRRSDRDGVSSPKGSTTRKVQDYLGEHRDVKPLAQITSARSRYAGVTNSNEVGTWATFDSSISVGPADTVDLGQPDLRLKAGQAFPHAVLHIRWEFTRMPEVVRAFESSHLVERVDNFTLEGAAIYTVVPDLDQPPWRELLQKDIRKVPTLLRKKGSSRSRPTTSDLSFVPVSSGPSSTEGPSDSIFSVGPGFSSATSDEVSPIISNREISSATKPKPPAELDRKQKQRARIVAAPKPEPEPQRYWNEFDDGDSDTNLQEAYAIYVDPNEPTFPGAETVSKAFGAMYDSLSRGKSRMISWLPLAAKNRESGAERTPLLFGARNTSRHASDADPESSSSEADEFVSYATVAGTPKKQTDSHGSHRRIISTSSTLYRQRQQLSPRQKALERTLFQFYTGLIAVSYMFLLMSSIILGTGRKKAVLEVDAGVITGVIAAETCTVISGVLLCMRRKKLGALHWGFMGVNIAAIVVFGVAILSLMVVGR